MSRRLVKKVISEKMVEWLNTIEDDELRIAVAKDISVAGGAINSIMCGGKINDFDVYFSSQQVCVRLLRYYLGDDVDITIDFVGTVNHSDVHGVRVVSAKGAYLRDVGYLNLSCQEGIAYQPRVLTENALTLTDKIQLIMRFVGKPENVLHYFDFVHAMCYFELDKRYVSLPPDALEAMVTRTLVYKGSQYPLASLFRMKKFLLRDWKMSAGQIVKIAMNLQEFDLNNPAVLREQLLGVDIMYMQELYAALHGRAEVDATYVGTIIDRLFNEGGADYRSSEVRLPRGLRLVTHNEDDPW